MIEQSASSASNETSFSLQIREYLSLVRRRRLWIILCSLGVFLCVAVIAIRMPNQYRAETTILVYPQKVNEGIVPSSVTGSVADRLSTNHRCTGRRGPAVKHVSHRIH